MNTIKHLKWDDCFVCPITGTIEKNQTPIENPINEVYEEANIKISKKNLVAGSYCVATTQMNETVFNFCSMSQIVKQSIKNKVMVQYIWKSINQQVAKL